MKLRNCLLMLLVVAFVLGCSEDKKEHSKSTQTEVTSTVFRTEYFIGDDQNYSFPDWFNDSVLIENNIQSIVHNWYASTTDDDLINVLQKSRRYTFDESGILVSMQQKRFYESLLVEDITFLYKDAPDEMGFVEVSAIDSLHPEELLEYSTYRKEEYQSAFAVYENNTNGDFLFCILKKRFQGILPVDSLFAPTPDDLIQYGKPTKPIKRYQIENLVKEKNTKQFKYFKGSSELRQLVSNNYPFSNKKSVVVSEKGQCTGFIDSTFSADEYLNRTISTFDFSENNLPVRLSHEGMRSGSYETFEYSFFQ